MEITVRLPMDESTPIRQFLETHGADYETVEQRGLDAAQIVDLIINYGPSTIVVLNGILDIISKTEKLRHARISIDASK